MKTCPNCRTQYTDDTLLFCLQDGSTLAETPVAPQTESLSGAEVETIVRPVTGSVKTRLNKRSADAEAAVVPPERKGSNVPLIVGGLALLMLLFAAAGAVGVWLYLRDPSPNVNTAANNDLNVNAKQGNSNAKASVTPTPSAALSPSVTENNRSQVPSGTATPARDTTHASREISDQVDAWKSHAESRDLDSQMQTYAPSVDYYRKRGASRDFIRADRERAYRLYDEMTISISNMDVTFDESGQTATAEFDKAWDFNGTRRSTGKVRQRLQFRKTGGQWLITGERDIKVY